MLTITEIKEKTHDIFKKHNIRVAYLFGSYAKGSATENSDVDILIDYDGIRKGIFKLSEIKFELADALNNNVDMLTMGALDNGYVSRSILANTICIYEVQ